MSTASRPLDSRSGRKARWIETAEILAGAEKKKCNNVVNRPSFQPSSSSIIRAIPLRRTLKFRNCAMPRSSHQTPKASGSARTPIQPQIPVASPERRFQPHLINRDGSARHKDRYASIGNRHEGMERWGVSPPTKRSRFLLNL